MSFEVTSVMNNFLGVTTLYNWGHGVARLHWLVELWFGCINSVCYFQEKNKPDELRKKKNKEFPAVVEIV